MLPRRPVLVACLAALCTACTKPPAPTTRTHVVGLWLQGERRGEERAISTIDMHRTTMQTDTSLDAPAAVRLHGELVLERGRATALRVTGETPPSLTALVNVATTPDRTDTFPIRGPLPVHVLSALVRQSMTASRRRFVTLPEGSATIIACPGSEAPFTDATCHAVVGLSSGRAFVWIDRRGQLAAAITETPWGTLIATPQEREATHPALAKRFDVYSARD
jgi:hypothetical protein